MSIPWARVRITHLSRKGQLTIPRVFLRELDLEPGTKLAITPSRGAIALVPVPVMRTGKRKGVMPK